MIDTHCHLEQPDYDADREEVIQRCRQQLHAVITSCANPKYFALTARLVRQYRGFFFATASVHPSYVKKIRGEELSKYIQEIKSNRDSLVAIGETGLDHNWVTDAGGQEKQKQLFVRLIALAEQLQLPLVIHSRDATKDTIEILEQHAARHVQMHMFSQRSLLKRVIDNGWFISVNTLLLKSKSIRKIVRDCPLEQLMLETDSPWLGIDKDGNLRSKEEVRNEPTAVWLVAEKIGEIKKTDLTEVDRQTTNNTINFFNLASIKFVEAQKDDKIDG